MPVPGTLVVPSSAQAWMEKLHLLVLSQTMPLICFVASNLLQVKFSSLRYLLPRAALREGCLMSVWRGLDRSSIVPRLSRLSSCSLGSALFLLCSLDTFALPAQACRLCSSVTQIPSPLLLLCPGAWLPSAHAEEAGPGQLSKQLAHASKLQTSPVCPASLKGRERFPSGIPAGLETAVVYPR